MSVSLLRRSCSWLWRWCQIALYKTNQSINQPVDCVRFPSQTDLFLAETVMSNQSINRSANQPIDCVCLPAQTELFLTATVMLNQSIKSVNRSTNQPIDCFPFPCQTELFLAVTVMFNQSINQSINRSINQLTVSIFPLRRSCSWLWRWYPTWRPSCLPCSWSPPPWVWRRWCWGVDLPGMQRKHISGKYHAGRPQGLETFTVLKGIAKCWLL